MPWLKAKRVLARSNAIPIWVVWPIVTVLFGVLAQLFVEGFLLLGALFLPLLLLVEGLSRSPRFAGIAVARRHVLGFAVAACLLMAASTAAFLTPLAPVESLNAFRALALFVILGLMVGALLRHMTGRLTLLTILAHKRLSLSVTLSFLWTLGVIFGEWARLEGALQLFVGGLGLGVLLQKGFRIAVERRIAGFRRLQEISEAWPREEPVTTSEVEAIQLLARGRDFPRMEFVKLRRHIEASRASGALSKRLSLVSAAVYRQEGEYEKCIDETQSADPAVATLEDAHLLLLRIIALVETGKDVEAKTQLERLLSTENGRRCPLATAFASLRLAEGALANAADVAADTTPLRLALEALALRREAMRRSRGKASQAGMEGFLARFSEFGVSADASLFRDIVGYAFLAAGSAEEARLFLEECIVQDRSFSNGYLHLGDYFLLRSELTYGASPSDSDLWHARACFEAARFTERNTRSRIRRLAEGRLALLKRARAGGARTGPSQDAELPASS